MGFDLGGIEAWQWRDGPTEHSALRFKMRSYALDWHDQDKMRENPENMRR